MSEQLQVAADQSQTDGGEGSELNQMVAAVQEAILSCSSSRGTNLTPEGIEVSMVTYALPVITEALTFVLASFAVQSGEIPSMKERRLLADKIRDDFVQNCKSLSTRIQSLQQDQRAGTKH